MITAEDDNSEADVPEPIRKSHVLVRAWRVAREVVVSFRVGLSLAFVALIGVVDQLDIVDLTNTIKSVAGPTAKIGGLLVALVVVFYVVKAAKGIRKPAAPTPAATDNKNGIDTPEGESV